VVESTKFGIEIESVVLKKLVGKSSVLMFILVVDEIDFAAQHA
jgi:hypothetical protein